MILSIAGIYWYSLQLWKTTQYFVLMLKTLWRKCIKKCLVAYVEFSFHFLYVSFVQAASIKDVPILQCHGDCDIMIPLQFGQMTHAKLCSFVDPTGLEFMCFTGLGHCSSPEVLYSAWSALCSNRTITWHLKKNKTHFSLSPSTTGQLTTHNAD